MIIISAGLLYIDYLIFLGPNPSLNGVHVFKSGISPVSDALNLIANAVILLQCKINTRTIGVPDTYDTVKDAFFSAVGVINIVAGILLALIPYYIFQRMNVPYLRNSEIIQRTMVMMEDRYDEHIGEGTGWYTEAMLVPGDDPVKEDYIVYLYWNNRQVQTYIEVLPNNSIIRIKDNFQAVKYSYYLEYDLYRNYLSHDFEVQCNKWEYDLHEEYKNYAEFLLSLPEGEAVNIIFSEYENSFYLKKTDIESVITALPENLEGNFVIELDQSHDYNFDDDTITITIPYSHNIIEFPDANAEGNFQSSEAVEPILSYSDEYLLEQIKTAVADADETGLFSDDKFIDYSRISFSLPVNEYLYKSGSIGFFKPYEEFYIVYSGDEMIGTAYLELVGNTYKYVLYTGFGNLIADSGLKEICLIHSAGNMYLYDGNDLVCIIENGDYTDYRDDYYDNPDPDLAVDLTNPDKEIDYAELEFTSVAPCYPNS